MCHQAWTLGFEILKPKLQAQQSPIKGSSWAGLGFVGPAWASLWP